MKILMVGVGAGSWQMRGVQLGRAMGARVTSTPRATDWAWADVVVLVKRAAITWAAEARRCGKPVVWDALDFWEQPEDNHKPMAEMITAARQIATDAGVTTVIGATQRMASDLGGVYLPHHCREGLTPQPMRAKAERVGYDGTKKYLGRWLKALEDACRRLGLTFVLHPERLSDVDVLVSFRDGKWDGPVCRAWKSGVKYVNAIAAGRPVLTLGDDAFYEMRPYGYVVSDTRDLIDRLADVVTQDPRDTLRARAFEDGVRRGPLFTVEAVARDYQKILSAVAAKVAA